jgi:hypothetical protein
MHAHSLHKTNPHISKTHMSIHIQAHHLTSIHTYIHSHRTTTHTYTHTHTHTQAFTMFLAHLHSYSPTLVHTFAHSHSNQPTNLNVAAAPQVLSATYEQKEFTVLGKPFQMTAFEVNVDQPLGILQGTRCPTHPGCVPQPLRCDYSGQPSPCSSTSTWVISVFSV